MIAGMDPTLAHELRALLEQQQLASLATLHKGAPAVSMVPYALLPDGRGFVLHVSRLATHTGDMQASPAVALLVMAPPGSAATPQETPRVSVQGRVRPLAPGSAEHDEARSCYLGRFPQSEPTFDFADFWLVVVEVRSVRFVAGFGRTTAVLSEGFAKVMGGSG
jgi:putative heme iron utilization protein